MLSIVDAMSEVLIDCDDLRTAPWKGSPNHLAGHCYVASEAVWWLFENRDWHPEYIRFPQCTHWYLRHRVSGGVLDVTQGQFLKPPPYETGRGYGFLTILPSKRAMTLLGRFLHRYSINDIMEIR